MICATMEEHCSGEVNNSTLHPALKFPSKTHIFFLILADQKLLNFSQILTRPVFYHLWHPWCNLWPLAQLSSHQSFVCRCPYPSLSSVPLEKVSQKGRHDCPTPYQGCNIYANEFINLFKTNPNQISRRCRSILSWTVHKDRNITKHSLVVSIMEFDGFWVFRLILQACPSSTVEQKRWLASL